MNRPLLQCIILAGLALAPLAVHAEGPSSAASEYEKLGRGIDEVKLIDETGQSVSWGTLAGKPRAVFFGFTKCPVICPVTVWELDAALARLGPKASAIQIVFVTLDPERDTAPVLKTYFSGFKARVRGMTGAPKDLKRVADAFEVKSERVTLKDADYTLDHTAAVFLLNERGVVVDTIAFGTPQDVIERRLRQLVEATPGKP
jgi:protein SCO1/2